MDAAALREVRQRFLAARESRQEAVDLLLAPGSVVVFISLSIPGAAKDIPGCAELFEWGMAEVARAIPPVEYPETGRDALGPYAFYLTLLAPEAAKQAAVGVEERVPAARLLDVDLYHRDRQIDRASLGLPPRRCLVCSEAAKECISTSRHSHTELVQAAHDLLRLIRS